MQKPRANKIRVALALAIGLSIPTAQSAIIAADGGITLYISYDNPDIAGGASWNDNITQVNSTTGASCTPTNNARANFGAANSPGSCPVGDTCLGREKIIGDLQNFATYVYQSTHGEHYLRRVYLSDNGRAWSSADVRWSVGSGGSSAPGNGWATPGSSLNMRSTARRCIHDVLHHEIGHYFYNLPDRYARGADGYYTGTIGGGAAFNVAIDVGDPNSVMAGNFPHLFVDTTNAQLTLSYNPPGPGSVAGEVLTPGLLSDADPSNDGPNRAHHNHPMPFAQDEWSILPTRHADLSGAHTEGDFSDPDFGMMPAVDIRFLGEDEPHPGTVLLLDRSGSMGVQTNGIPASQYVQEAGMYLYHSSLVGDYIGTHLYNGAVEILFDYDEYDASNQLLFANFRPPLGLTNIAAALESGIDALIAEHGEDGAQGGKIILMSDGKQTTGASLWDQVDRAVDKGIQIHTLSFGNADTATMAAISTATDGEVIEMSESSDGSELKLGLNREMSEIRGLTPVHFYKGPLTANATTNQVAYHEGSFQLPPLTRTLQFYTFLELGNAAFLRLELEDAAGNIFHANPQNVATKGRLNGITVQKPLKGDWKFRIYGTKRTRGQLPADDRFEVIAFAENRDLETKLRIEPAGAKFPGQFRILAQLQHRYPLTNVKAIADIYRGSQKLASLPLYDHGKVGIDDQAKDGTYSALIDPQKLAISNKRPKVRVDVRFITNALTQPAPNAHYETGTRVESLIKDYAARAKAQFSAFATDTVSFSANDESKPQIHSLQPDAPLRVKPGSTGKLQVTVENAYLSRQHTRVSLGQGITTKLVSITPQAERFRSTLVLVYEVGKEVKGGSRDLLIQSNHTRLTQPNALVIGDAQVKAYPVSTSTGPSIQERTLMVQPTATRILDKTYTPLTIKK